MSQDKARPHIKPKRARKFTVGLLKSGVTSRGAPRVLSLHVRMRVPVYLCLAVAEPFCVAGEGAGYLAYSPLAW